MYDPSFSVIVPTYRRRAEIARCLEALARLSYPKSRFEVIVVDDGGDCAAGDLVDRFRECLDVTLLTQAHAGPAVARNTGAAQARGEFLAFTDDDCMPARDWLTALAARFRGDRNQAIGGQTVNTLASNPFSIASDEIIAYLYSYYNVDPEHARFLASSNLGLPADRFRAMGGFDGAFPRAAAEDRDLCDRWLGHGYRLVYAPEVVVYHAHRLTASAFWRQHFNYGRGAFRFRRARKERGTGKLGLEPAGFYVGLLRHPFERSYSPWERARLSALLLVSQVATAAGYVWARAGTRHAETTAL